MIHLKQSKTHNIRFFYVYSLGTNQISYSSPNGTSVGWFARSRKCPEYLPCHVAIFSVPYSMRLHVGSSWTEGKADSLSERVINTTCRTGFTPNSNEDFRKVHWFPPCRRLISYWEVGVLLVTPFLFLSLWQNFRLFF